MKTKRTIIIVYLVSLILPKIVNAQDLKTGLDIGVKGGASFSVMLGTDDDTQSIISPTIGVTVGYTFPSLWGIESGLEIKEKGGAFEDLVKTDKSSYYVDNTVRTTYLEMPIRAIYKVQSGKQSCVAFFAGPYIAYGLKGKIDAKIKDARGGAVNVDHDILLAEAGYIDDQKAFEKGVFKRFDYGISLGIGVEFTRHIDARFTCDFGLADLNDGFYGGRRTNQTGTFTVGYHF